MKGNLVLFYVPDHARHVKLDSDGIEKCAEALAERLSSAKLSLNDLFVKTSVHPQKANEKGVEWIFFADALNFSFWNNEDQPQYLVTYKVKFKGLLFRPGRVPHDLVASFLLFRNTSCINI